MEQRKIVGNVIYSVSPRGSIRTNKPSTIEMAVDHRFANRADDLFLDLKNGEEPQGQLKRLELVAVYDDGRGEEVIPVDLKSKEEIVEGEDGN